MNNTASAAFSVENEIDRLTALAEKYRNDRSNTIAILQDIQEAFGYVPENAVNWLADDLFVPRAGFFGVATFYSQFYLKPRGANIVTVCCGTACHVKGSEKILNNLMLELKLSEGQDTTADLRFTLEKVNCVGACSIAPVVIVNKSVNGKAASDKIIKQVRQLAGGKAEEHGESKA
jgi:NADH:ubiquinone oxidoreductase subunit E